MDRNEVKLAVFEALDEYASKHLVGKTEYEKDKGKIYAVAAFCVCALTIGTGKDVLHSLMRFL